MAQTNRPRCPVCNRYGNTKLKDNLCRSCFAKLEQEGAENPRLKPEAEPAICIINRCGQPAMVINGVVQRYCQEHTYGTQDERYSLRRANFNTPRNDPAKGWRQVPGKSYDIVRDEYPIVKGK